MADDDNQVADTSTPAPAAEAPKKRAAAKKSAVKKTAKKATTTAEGADSAPEKAPAKKAAAKKSSSATAAKKTAAKKTSAKKSAAPAELDAQPAPAADTAEAPATGTMLLFKAPDAATPPPRARAAKKAVEAPTDDQTAEEAPARPAKKSPAAKKTTAKKASGGRKPSQADVEQAEPAPTDDAAPAARESGERDDASDDDSGEGGTRRRRRRGGRRRRKPGDGESSDTESAADGDDDEAADDDSGEGTRRRRKRRREGDNGGGSGDDPSNTVTRVRRPRSAEDEITSIQGSTRLEAKKQRRREGREAGRRRAPIVSEAEFLARRESVDRVMVVRQRDDLTQIGVLEDKVLVEHYVARESQTSLIGNVYLGRVQNVLPSMEAAFIDIGRGRNAVIYAGEVNWSALGHKEGSPRKIESVLSSGQTILVQVTKDPIGHKGARLTSQVSLAGRFLVYVPDGTTSGISRKLPDTERSRLKTLLKEIVPDSAGVIVRTAAEGASEDELTRDVERLTARWEDIESKVGGTAPQLLYGEPDLTLKVVRDLFTEDFAKLVIQGDDAWETVQQYVAHVAPDLEERLERYDSTTNTDVFAAYRIDEQIAKGLDRKVWLPSGGSLIIDRTEAMTVVDVNTGKFTGSGGNLEETVTKNNLEAAEEMVRQLRLRDIGGIIVVDFIDMVLESNRDLVLRRLVECLGRDRTRHQVAEVTSLGLVQMTRKRIGTGLVETFSENCEHCQGRGVVIQDTPVEPRKSEDDSRRGGRGGGGGGGGGGGDSSSSSGGDSSSGGGRRRGGRGRNQQDDGNDSNSGGNGGGKAPSPAEFAAMAKADARSDQAESSESAQAEPASAQPEASPEPAAAPEPPQVVTRTRRRGAGRAAEPVESAAPVEIVAAPELDTAPEPDVASEPLAAPEAPKVVTRTRRRGASRPAEAAAPVEPVVAAESAAAPEPASTPVVPEVEVVAAEAPKVVTRTRGRSASRAAGPPAAPDEPSQARAAAGDIGTPPDSGLIEPNVGSTEPGSPAIEHVPVKKKGTRKR